MNGTRLGLKLAWAQADLAQIYKLGGAGFRDRYPCGTARVDDHDAKYPFDR